MFEDTAHTLTTLQTLELYQYHCVQVGSVCMCFLTVHSVLFVIFKQKSDANSSSDRHTLLQSIVC